MLIPGLSIGDSIWSQGFRSWTTNCPSLCCPKWTLGGLVGWLNSCEMLTDLFRFSQKVTVSDGSLHDPS